MNVSKAGADTATLAPRAVSNNLLHGRFSTQPGNMLNLSPY